MPEYLRLYGDIGEGDCSAAAFTAELAKVPEFMPIVVAINSRGGNYFDGVAIYNTLKKRRDVTVRVDGLAASAASYVAMAAERIVMRIGARLMIHSPMAGVRGNPAEIQTTLNVLKELEAEMAVAYVEKSNLTPIEMLKLMRSETWFTLREAQKVFRGIEADDMKVAASINPEWLRTFSNAPLDLVVDMHTAAAKPKPKVSAGEQRAAKKRRAARRKRMMLMAAAKRPDPVTAKRQRQRRRLEIAAKVRQSKAAAELEARIAARRDEAERRAALEVRAAAQRAKAKASREAEYARVFLNIPRIPR